LWKSQSTTKRFTDVACGRKLEGKEEVKNSALPKDAAFWEGGEERKKHLF